ncbi:DUF4097 family beta strand repeat-containing protein [Streptomonospora wellingtoniae]|uniref:DUF4097 family beta strand repeat-containing protein n=1 Tax=Streptomonospora wellingtoniae TaxID=3075544 RepID=A0ABU2KVB5_9ACTN|nr:DUF4097 family beta strand repeat-containing protein [Streptomonospora sp. DSM 45055]MDT0303198.1 DUF4097 family beta strand repeat-containing protein [Streptomonospora sp. DSM 45055]
MTFTGRGLYAASSKEPRRRSGWLLIGAVLALAVLVGGALLSFDSVQLGGDSRTEEFPDAEAIELSNNTSGDIAVYHVPGDAIVVKRTLQSTPLAEPEASASMERGTLSAEADCGGVWFLGGCEADYSIGVPEGTEVNIDASSGDVELEGITGAVDVEAGSGSIAGENLTGDIRAATTTGEIELDDVEGDLETESTTGSISAEGSGGTVAADTTTGQVDLGEFTAESFDVETTTGTVDLEAGFDRARIETTTGSVELEALESFDSLEVDTTTGSVDVQVPEDSYRVDGDSTTGERDISVDTAAGGGGPRIAVSTTTGSVSVSADD